MARIIVFDPVPTPNPILEHLTSADTSQYITRKDVLIEPDMDAVAGIPMRYWKHLLGVVIPMTLAEQNAVDTAIIAKALADSKIGAQEIFNNPDAIGRLTRALILTILDEVNILRAASALTPRTTAQLKNAVLNKANSSDSD